MAATQTLVPSTVGNRQPQKSRAAAPFLLTAALTLVAVLIHGYHPYAEDGGIYLPGIFKLLHPELYPAWTGFVTAQTRFSLFAPMMAILVRTTGVGVMTCMFWVYVLSIWGTLHASWLIASRCVGNIEARCGAVVVFCLCMTMPAAGTSLLLVDPYVTARSLSTPLGLLAILGTLDLLSEFRQTGRLRLRSLGLPMAGLVFAILMHPLMGSYTACCLATLVCASIPNRLVRNASLAGVLLFALLAATLVNGLAPAQPAGYAAVAQTRSYWFLSAWQWYEIVGLVAPLLLVWAIAEKAATLSDCGRWMARMAVWAGLAVIAVSLTFAHANAHNYFVAMLQPLRIFHTVYIVLILLSGALLAKVFLERDPVRWTATFLVLGALMFFVQIRTFPHSSHIELPGLAASNDWEQGFLWIRNTTPKDALFALDPHYIEGEGEDSQNFRAIAERSAIPDITKDGGIAAVAPALTPAWMSGKAIDSDLATASDDRRLSKLAPAHVRWIVLPSKSETRFPCPYQNREMKVCQVPLF
ncbi:hypothetical protein [Occallatibacter savannae]|uniref:hypothetical protein n=1 Tax=Occallatibacter savannae TaxID=1002691 RepID=UPI0013A5459F|nr:hypothetical protein [Occallatibacter savannae]